MKKKIYLALLTLAICSTLSGCGVKQVEYSITLEAGQEYDITATDFLKISEKKARKVKIDTSDIDIDKVGEYDLTAEYKNKDYTVTVTVQDTTAPTVELSEVVVKVDDFSKLEIGDVVGTAFDISGYEVKVVGYEKVANLEEATEEYLAGLSGKTSGVETKGLDDSEPTEEGVYRIVFSFADMYENETLAEIYVVYDIAEGGEVGEVEDDKKEDENVKGDVKDEPSTEVGGGTTVNKGEGNKGENNKGDDKKPSGGSQQSGSTETQKPSGGNSGNSGTQQGGTTEKPNDGTETEKPNGGGTQQGGNTETQKPNGGSGSGSTTPPKEEVGSADTYFDAVINAGYYKVTPIVGNGISAGQYGVMVKDYSSSETLKGEKLLRDFLADMGYVPTGISGSWVDSGEGYMIYCTGVEEKGIENEFGF